MKKKKEKMKTVPFRKYFYECDCHTEGLITDEDEDFIFISLWNLGFMDSKKLCLKDKLRLIWNIIKEGKPWTDEIVLRPDTAIEISEDLFARGVRLKQTSTLNKKVKKNASKTKG